MSIKFEFLQHAGESIVVTINGNHSILIDGGHSHPFKSGFKYEASEENIKALVVTHIDADHIAGAIELLKRIELLPNLEVIIFNEPRSSQLFNIFNENSRTSTAQGTKLTELIEKNAKIKHLFDICVGHKDFIQFTDNTCLKLLSPSPATLDKLHKKWNFEEYKKSYRRTSSLALNRNDLSKNIEELASRPLTPDSSLPNESSLAFLLECRNRKFLFLGDAHIDQIVSGLKYWGYDSTNPLYVDFIKLSHHGSRCNISKEFLETVRTNTFIVCQASFNLLKHPDRETIAKIAMYGQEMDQQIRKSILLTKDKRIPNHLIFSQDEYKKYNFLIKYINSKIYDL